MVEIGLGKSIFNIDVDNPTLLKMNANDQTFSKTNFRFGFSIALEKSSAYIGAPNYIDGGALFRCNLETPLKKQVKCDIIDELHKWTRKGWYYNFIRFQLQRFAITESNTTEYHRNISIIIIRSYSLRQTSNPEF